jgi:hypothetical protein
LGASLWTSPILLPKDHQKIKFLSKMPKTASKIFEYMDAFLRAAFEEALA